MVGGRKTPLHKGINSRLYVAYRFYTITKPSCVDPLQPPDCTSLYSNKDKWFCDRIFVVSLRLYYRERFLRLFPSFLPSLSELLYTFYEPLLLGVSPTGSLPSDKGAFQMSSTSIDARFLTFLQKQVESYMYSFDSKLWLSINRPIKESLPFFSSNLNELLRNYPWYLFF